MPATVENPDVLQREPAAQRLIRELCSIITQYLDSKQVYEVIQAAHYAVEAHSGQMRKSGEAYICHPLAVAIILAEMRMDTKGIMAGLLHDVLEDTGTPKLRLIDDFGGEIAEMVDGVSKLSRLDSKSRAQAQAENMRKMFLAMGRDLRVIVVKLSDRLHNMRTIKAMSQEAQRRIAKETLEIYAPIANRLGMNQIRLELEDLGFKALYPMRYRVLKQALKDARGRRKEVMAPMEIVIRDRFQTSGIECTIAGREKHLYSIYKKMRSKKLSFTEIYDVYAFRVLTRELDDCYRSLGVVHGLYKPVPEKFKDYIAVQKANGYQSLHTVVIGSYGLPVEFQIRTNEMHTRSETGIAAHWAYKSDDQDNQDEKTFAHEWLRGILEIQDHTGGDPMEFIDHLKVDLFPDEIYLFTPQGGIIKLPRGATVVDFAYAVHTDLGNSSVSARINRHLAPLHTQLENGQTVEVITTDWAKPNPVWLNYVVTAKARAGIRAYLRNFKQKEAVSLGRNLLERELTEQGSSLAEIPESDLSKCLHAMGLDSLTELLEAIGLGNRMPFLVAKRLSQPESQAGIKLDNHSSSEFEQPVTSVPLLIKGSEGVVVNMAKCCRPIPGDCIVGFFHPGRGIVVHRCECHTASSVQKKQGNWLDVEWQSNLNDQEFTIELQLELLNQRGALAKLAFVIASAGSNIENISVRNEDGVISSDVVLLTVKDRIHLAQVMRKIKQLPVVTKLFRVSA